MVNSKIIGTGHYLPKRILTNFDLEKMVETSDEWITERTGIKERHIVADGELTSDLAYNAAVNAINDAKITPNDINGIIIATITPDRFCPATAAIIQKKLGITNGCFAMDISAACSGFVYALTLVDALIKNKQAKNILIIGVESLSKMVDWTDRNTCVLFGDGAGAVVVSATEEENKGVLISNIYSDGSYSDILKSKGGISAGLDDIYLYMEGREVFKLAVDKMYNSVIETLTKINLTPKDVDLLIPHQANKRIIDSVVKKLELDESKCYYSVQKHGNTSAASIPLALSCARQEGRIKEGDLICFEAMGAGLTWGSVILRW